MKHYDELCANQILYLAEAFEFWDHEKQLDEPDGMLSKYTKITVHIDDSPEVIFKVLDGEHKGKLFMWGWNGESEAKPEDLLTEKEFREINEINPVWKETLNLVTQCPQRQDSLTDQMIDLYEVANKLGFYDAADFIKTKFIEK